METKRVKTIKTEPSSPNSAEFKVLKSTSNIGSPPSDSILINNSTSLVITNNSKTPQVSYRVVNLNTQNSLPLSPTSGSSNQLLLMMPNNQNTFIKKGDPFSKTVIDQKRRMLHKEIERRRRDKINDWIFSLSKEVPDCASDRTKQGQSKGGILAKAVKYIQELRAENSTLVKEKEELSSELNLLKKELSEIKEENSQLKSSLDLKLHSKK